MKMLWRVIPLRSFEWGVFKGIVMGEAKKYKKAVKKYNKEAKKLARSLKGFPLILQGIRDIEEWNNAFERKGTNDAFTKI